MSDLSSIYEAKVAVFDLLTAELPLHTDTADVPVFWGRGEANERVLVWTGEADTEFATIGGPTPRLNEDFRVDLIVEATIASGRNLRPAEQRMWTIAQVVGETIRENGLVGHRCLFSRPSRTIQEYFQTDKRQGSRARISLAGKARI